MTLAVIASMLLMLLTSAIGITWLVWTFWVLTVFLSFFMWAVVLGATLDVRWMVILLATLMRSTPVRLLFYDGTEVSSIAIKLPDGSMRCSVYWLTNVGDCHLLPNGLVSRHSESNYVMMWWPLRKTEMIYHQLRNDLPDLGSIKQLGKNERIQKMREFVNGIE